VNAIRATWTNGQIVPAEPVEWPEGSELRVEAVAPDGAKTGMTEQEWGDYPESIAAWIAAVEKIEPMIWAVGEREEYERYREKVRQFNLEAVRMQMKQMPQGDAP
jgi:N-methylhydantoinase B/oxoprolinase/acetone carboxylase alpha subunit